jgi:hypothetical protein
MAPIADRRPTEIMIQFRGVAIATPQLQNVLGRSCAANNAALQSSSSVNAYEPADLRRIRVMKRDYTNQREPVELCISSALAVSCILVFAPEDVRFFLQAAGTTDTRRRLPESSLFPAE